MLTDPGSCHTGHHRPEFATAPPAASGGAGGVGHRRDEDLRQLAMTNLLGLKTDFAFWNPGLAESPAPDPAPPQLDELPDPAGLRRE
jgi:hypothetical protein